MGESILRIQPHMLGPHPINRNPLNPSILWNYGLDRKILFA